MKINALSTRLLNTVYNYPHFCSRKQFNNSGCTDTFEYRKSPDKDVINLTFPDGRKQKAFIKKLPPKPSSPEKRYIIEMQGKKLGNLSYIVDAYEEEVYVGELYTKDNKFKDKNYKGAGSELLKIAVQDSIKNGFGGKLSLDACFNPAPFVFYYKNNLMPDDNGSASYILAAIHYAASKNINVGKLLPKNIVSLYMRLDEQGADALLNGKRLYETREVIPLRQVKIKDKTIDFTLIELPNKEFAVISLDLAKKHSALLSSLKGTIKQDEHGRDYIELNEFYCPDEQNNSLKRASIKSVEIFANSKGIKKVQKNIEE